MTEREERIVSAIILTHNRLELLKRAIDSVFSQTWPYIECIIVDNSSTDGTREYCQSRKDIRYFFCTPPKRAGNGCNFSRNLGIKVSTGTFIAFLDDDDYWFPTKIEKQVALMDEKGCGVVFCGIKREIIDKGATTYEYSPVDHNNEGDISQKYLLNPFGITTSQLLIKKDLIEKVGYFDERIQFWQEMELILRISQLTEFYAVDECLLNYRIEKTDRRQQYNRFNGWGRTILYIYLKHYNLFKKLSKGEGGKRIRRYLLRDAYHRAKRAHAIGWTAMFFVLYRLPKMIREIKA